MGRGRPSEATAEDEEEEKSEPLGPDVALALVALSIERRYVVEAAANREEKDERPERDQE